MFPVLFHVPPDVCSYLGRSTPSWVTAGRPIDSGPGGPGSGFLFGFPTGDQSIS